MSAPSPSQLRIVGAGNIGEALARHWTRAGHTVKIANSRGPETLADVAERTGATAATIEDAVNEANEVVVSIPQKNVVQLGEKKLISRLSKDTIVIDTGNYVRSHLLAHAACAQAAQPVACSSSLCLRMP